MKITMDTERGELVKADGMEKLVVPLYSKEAFELISDIWVKVGWNEKYPYTFTWLGRPIIQLPEDMVRIQEVIWKIKPDVIIETGIAHGGSLVFYASLCKAMNKGRVIGVDIEIAPKNREALEAHPLYPYISMIEGSSVDPKIVTRVERLVKKGEKIMVMLDSNHTKSHVMAELEAYSHLVSPGSYIVAMDGIMKDLHDAPRGRPDWVTDNPCEAIQEFLDHHPEFVEDAPQWSFNESELSKAITHWPGAWLRRKLQ
jgi:cephalosporin hydroxylase